MGTNRRLFLVLVFVAGVIISFWMVSRYPALGSKAALSGTAAFGDPLTNQPHFRIPENASLPTRVFYTTLNWYETNWRGMVFGLFLAGGFLTLLGYLPKKPGNRRFRNSFLGMFVGTPLGVCVNCVAPIAKGLYEAGSRMETALAVMFSSPTLNIVVLTMLFTIFPFYMAIMKLGATFVLVLLIVPLISEKKPAAPESAACPVPETPVHDPGSGREPWTSALKGSGRDYWKNFRYIVVRTVPLMLLAGFLGALLSHLWNFERLIGVDVNWVNLGLISIMGTFLPLPIAFDLMLAQALMMSGLADGFIMTLLFTLGTFSIYSAMIVYRTFSPGLAFKLFAIVFLAGAGLGYIANSYSEHRYVQWLESYDEIVGTGPGVSLETDISPPSPVIRTASIASDFFPTAARRPQPFWESAEVFIQSIPHRPRNSSKGKPFTKFTGPEFGITYSNTLTPAGFFDPLFFGRGIASGDFNGDGWTDLAAATRDGMELYQNIDGKTFKPLRFPGTETLPDQGINLAMVDMNNDGLLDIFISTFDHGNFLILNPRTESKDPHLVPLPKNRALLTNSSAFGDINGDGFLDIVNGNYFLGILTRTPMDTATDRILINRGLQFEVTDLDGVPGQTQTSLISDINDDGAPDLMIGNDYLVPDSYFLGDGKGGFRKIIRRDQVIPRTTENTMSMDTGDFNNDLIPDIYLANIGFSRGIDVVSNIFGKDMKDRGKAFCDSGISVLGPERCRELIQLVTLLNPEKQDTSERCYTLTRLRAVRECMVTRMALLAARKNDSSLCEKISRDHPLARKICLKYFLAKRMEAPMEEEIPQRSLSNILLAGEKDHVFMDVSKHAGVTTAEWSWNAKFADLDNDEWQDLFVVNGVLITQEFAPNKFFHNQEGKQFSSDEAVFGLDDLDHSSSYTYLDIDNDGDLDIITNTLYGPFKVYINNEAKRNSVTFLLRDNRGNRFCVGCKIVIHYGPGGGRRQVREIKAGGGFHSYDAPVAHFGLGLYETIHRVDIRWSTGETTSIKHPFLANREYRIQRRNQRQTAQSKAGPAGS